MRVVALLVLVGCSKSATRPIDAAIIDATDAEIRIDAEIDAPMIDAPIDAPADAAVPTCTPTAGMNLDLSLVIGPCGAPGSAPAPQCTESPVMLVTAPRGDPRQFLVERAGAIRILEHGVARPTPFLDLSIDAGGPVDALGGEQGLFGLVFHPNYAQNRQFFVFHTTVGIGTQFANVVVRYTAMATDPYRADPATATRLITLPTNFSVGYGGMMAFGADGYLYVGTGDADQSEHSQDPTSLFGKFLRVDVDHPSGGRPYGIPTDNPHADGVAGAPEVFATGLRNPWRWAFDRVTGDLWVADVGESTVEEVDVVPPGSQLGANFGWPMYEADHCHAGPCIPGGKVFPSYTRLHSDGWHAIIGGDVYRGPCFPDLQGWFFFSDYGARVIVRARREANGTLSTFEYPLEVTNTPASIHGDGFGEIYLTDVLGGVWHIAAKP